MSRLLLARRGTLGHAVPPIVVPVSELADTFDGSIDTGTWTQNYGTYAQAGGAAEVTAATDGVISAFRTDAHYTLADSSLFVQMAPPSAEDSSYAFVLMSVYTLSSGFTTWVRLWIDSVSSRIGWNCLVEGDTEFDRSFIATSGYEWLAVNPFVRLSEADGTLSFDASLDGHDWVNIDTQPTPADIGSAVDLSVNLEAYRSEGSSSAGDPATFDNVNTPGEASTVLSAGADATVSAGSTFTRTATEPSGATITARAWTIVSGPVGEGAKIGSSAALSWRPGASLSGSNDIRQPTFEEISYEITSTAENSQLDWYNTNVYGYIEDIDDDRGYTAGIVGFTTGTGDLLLVVQRYNTLSPGNQLSTYTSALTTLANEGEGPNAGNRANQLLGSTFRSRWASLAVSDPLFRLAQRELRDEMYWEPALAQALDDGVGPLGLAILYDISVNHGPGDDSESFGGIVAAAQDDEDPPSDGGNEAAYLNALVDARLAILLDWWDDGDPDEDPRVDGRVSAHRSLINSGNLTLAAPISWSMYGDDFVITTRPDPPADVVRGTYVLRYTATGAGSPGYDELTLTVT